MCLFTLLFGQVPDNTPGMNKRKNALQCIYARTTHTGMEQKTLSVYGYKWRNVFLLGV